jgi:F0F1-type ATP synthase delta subunit
MSKVSNQELARIIYSLIAKGMPAKKITAQLAEYLVSEHRTRDLDAVMREVKRLRLTRDEIMEVDVVSVFPVTDSLKSKVSKLFGSKETIFNESIDPQLIGGARFTALEREIDLTFKRQLDTLTVKA